MTGFPGNNQELSKGKKTQEISLRERFLNVRTVLSFALAFSLLFFLLTRLDIDFASAWEKVLSCSPILYILAFISYYLTFPLRGFRWRLLLNNAGFDNNDGANLPSFWRLSEFILLNWFVNSILYARLGDAYRAYLLREDSNASFSKAMGTVVAERFIDVVIVFLLLIIAVFGLWGGRTTGTVDVIVWVCLGLVLALAIALGAMRLFGMRFEQRLPSRVKSIYGLFQEGAFGSFRQLPLLAFLSLGIWGLEAGRLFFVTQALGVSIPWPLPFLILFAAMVTALLSALPFTPGGLGFVEAGVVGLLMYLGKAIALSITLVDRTITFLSIILFGFILFLVRQVRRRGGRRMEPV